MTYKITEINIQKEQFVVNVTFEYKDGKQEDFSIYVFEPQTKEQVIESIENRYITEQRIRDIELKNEQIMTELSKDIDKVKSISSVIETPEKVDEK
jgi:adenine deaminase